MTTPELIAELERLDAAATKGPWECDGNCVVAPMHQLPGLKAPFDAIVFTVCHDMCPEQTIEAHNPVASQSNIELCAFSGTHRGAILAKLRRLERAEELLLRVADQPFCTDDDITTRERIDAFLKENEA